MPEKSDYQDPTISPNWEVMNTDLPKWNWNADKRTER